MWNIKILNVKWHELAVDRRYIHEYPRIPAPNKIFKIKLMIFYISILDFMVRRVLLADPDSRWCPAPDCSYAVIATGCASCPRLKCERPGCNLQFCYHCKAEWHPDQTCDAARAARHSPTRQTSGGSQDSQNRML